MAVRAFADWPCFPFCSTRCKTIDLGRWLKESYGVQAEEPEDADGIQHGSRAATVRSEVEPSMGRRRRHATHTIDRCSGIRRLGVLPISGKNPPCCLHPNRNRSHGCMSPPATCRPHAPAVARQRENHFAAENAARRGAEGHYRAKDDTREQTVARDVIQKLEVILKDEKHTVTEMKSVPHTVTEQVCTSKMVPEMTVDPVTGKACTVYNKVPVMKTVTLTVYDVVPVEGEVIKVHTVHQAGLSGRGNSQVGGRRDRRCGDPQLLGFACPAERNQSAVADLPLPPLPSVPCTSCGRALNRLGSRLQQILPSALPGCASGENETRGRELANAASRLQSSAATKPRFRQYRI